MPDKLHFCSLADFEAIKEGGTIARIIALCVYFQTFFLDGNQLIPLT
jgi:hypothetical protein